MGSESTKANSQSRRPTDELGTTRRAVLAAGGAVALSGFAGCTDLDGLLDRASEQVVGTTASAPATFYAGRTSADASASVATNDEHSSSSYGNSLTINDGTNDNASDGTPLFSTDGIASTHTAGSDESRVFRTDPADVRPVPATARAESREIELEGWSISAATVRKSPPPVSITHQGRIFAWWAGPDDDIDDEDDDIVVAVLGAELALLSHVTTAQNAVERREQAAAERALDAFIDTTRNALRPELDRCGEGVCETVRENSDIRVQGVRAARNAVAEGNWTVAAGELAGVEEIVLRDIERLDDELVDRYPGRPRFTDIIGYLRDEPTIGERFTVCLPDTRLPGDRGSLAAELTPERVLAYFAASHEPDGIRPPFGDRYGSQGISYNDEGCIQIDGPISLHKDLSCGTILSAELDTYRTENRAIVGYSTDGGAVVSSASASADTDGKCVFVAADGTLREARNLNDEGVLCWGQRRAARNGESVLCWGRERSAGDASVSPTLVCPVAVTPEDCPCPLPGLFYIRRCLHDNQVIFAGGWLLDEGALYEDSSTLLVDEGPTEVASVTPEDIESDDYDDRIVEQFSRGRSQQGSAVISGRFDGGAFPKEWTLPRALQTEQGRRGLNAVNVKIRGEQGGGDAGDEGDEEPSHVSITALDAPLVHLANAAGTDNVVKFKAGAELSKSVN